MPSYLLELHTPKAKGTVVGQGLDSVHLNLYCLRSGKRLEGVGPAKCGLGPVDYQDSVRDCGYAPYLRGRRIYEADGRDGRY